MRAFFACMKGFFPTAILHYTTATLQAYNLCMLAYIFQGEELELDVPATSDMTGLP